MKTPSILKPTVFGSSLTLALLFSAAVKNIESVVSSRETKKFLQTENRAYTFIDQGEAHQIDSGEALLKSDRSQFAKDDQSRKDRPPSHARQNDSFASLTESFGSRQRYLKSCVPASAAMAGSLATNMPITERQMRDAIKPGHNWNQSGISVTKAATALQLIGIKAHVITYDQISSALAQGPVIVVVPTGENKTHAVVCTGRDAGGVLSIWNPDPPIGYRCHMKMTSGSILRNFPAVSVPKSRGRQHEDEDIELRGGIR